VPRNALCVAVSYTPTMSSRNSGQPPIKSGSSKHRPSSRQRPVDPVEPFAAQYTSEYSGLKHHPAEVSPRTYRWSRGTGQGCRAPRLHLILVVAGAAFGIRRGRSSLSGVGHTRIIQQVTSCRRTNSGVIGLGRIWRRPCRPITLDWCGADGRGRNTRNGRRVRLTLVPAA
jgi:hypothetical protein